MKHVLLYGDSIRAGYDVTVRALLKDIAAVSFPEENCRFAMYLYRYMKEWADASGIAPNDIDCIHWNTGLWDIWIPDEQGPICSISEYSTLLTRICRSMRSYFPNAEIVFATSTPMREDHPWRKNSDVITYNQAAIEVADSTGMYIDDLYTLGKSLPLDCYSDTVHFYTVPATIAFSRQVSDSICAAMGIETPIKTDEELLAHIPKQVNVVGY